MHIRPTRGLLGLSLLFAAALAAPRLASAGEWQLAGLLHAGFARALANDGIRFDPKLLEWVSDFIDEDGDCPTKPAAKQLSELERQRVQLFRTKYCQPWNQAWRVCDSGQPPSWCGAPSTVADELET